MGLGALSERTAQLPRLDLQIPKRIIGRNTEECILSGTIVGMAAMLDGMVQRIEAELGSPRHPHPHRRRGTLRRTARFTSSYL